ncbi:hypothetical protein [Nocardioides taihuensis]|uniref:Baseplate assembly protein n=1 Tax=Nocardioides taihuensis TaxID=1835606 RepID=A0ABW0BDB7_9ACTN
MSDQRRDCGCPPAGATATPARVDNPPGLPAVRRRVGTSGAFASAMEARLTRSPALSGLTTRDADDPTIALVDAWSSVLDVLAFYTERVANEAYLRTAVDPRSLSELAHEVGYQPLRGRASATVLALTLEDAVGAPDVVPVPTGTRVASLPGPGEVPQTYETTAELVARPAWNAIAARARVPQQVGVGHRSVLVDGLRSDLAVGDAVLLVGREREASSADTHWAFRRLASVERLPGLDATRIGWVDPLGEPATSTGRHGVEQLPDARDLRLYVLRTRAAIFGAAAPDWRLISQSVGGGRPDGTGSSVPVTRSLLHAEHRGRRRDTLESRALPGPDWPGFSVVAPGQPENTVDLDATYPAASPGSWVVLARTGVTVLYRVMATTETSRTDFTLNAKVSRLSLTGPTASHLFGASVRETTAFVGSELLPLATGPDPLPVQGEQIVLARPVPTLEAGRRVVVVGPRPRIRVAEGVRTLTATPPGRSAVHLHPGDELEVSGRVDDNGDGTVTWRTTRGLVTGPADALQPLAPAAGAPRHREEAVVAGPTPDSDEVDTLVLTAALTGCYDRDAVRVLANVVTATHGESRAQVLGGGDAALTYQHFTLQEPPLTYVPSASGGGVTSTLEVRVDGRLWREVPQLFGCGPDDEVYVTATDDEGTVTVTFGDGRTGSRLPTGAGNVTARYRVGTGMAGRLDADVLTLPMTRPLGLRAVTNPLPTGLAADPETPADVRAHAPRTALTLDRVVSLRDVEDFARGVPGIGKAVAARLWDGRRRFVHLTVAGSGGQVLDTEAIRNLRDALLGAGDARLPLEVQAAEVVAEHVSLTVVVDPAYGTREVLDGVTRSVTAALSEGDRELGQPLTEGDVILAAHAVAGVVAVTVTVPRTDVPSSSARVVGGVTMPAQLVVLAAGGLTVTEASS